MWKDTASGIAGSVACTVLGSPFDVAKSRMQSGRVGLYDSLADCLVRTLRQEGPLALYKGVFPALSSAVSENAIGITVNRELRRRLVSALGNEPEIRFSMATECLLGGGTGVFTAVTICPVYFLAVSNGPFHDRVRTS